MKTIKEFLKDNAQHNLSRLEVEGLDRILQETFPEPEDFDSITHKGGKEFYESHGCRRDNQGIEYMNTEMYNFFPGWRLRSVYVIRGSRVGFEVWDDEENVELYITDLSTLLNLGSEAELIQHVNLDM